MKIGFRKDEPLDKIIMRKLQEESEAGFTFWGYGGTLCHPIKVIRPFAASCEAKGLSVTVLMSRTESRLLGQPGCRKEYSTDRKDWQPLPRGIRTGSPYALVMRNFRACEARLDLSLYAVGYGPSEHRRLTEYLGFRVDKAPGLLSRPAVKLAPKLVPVSYRADLVEPYAVVLR